MEAVQDRYRGSNPMRHHEALILAAGLVLAATQAVAQDPPPPPAASVCPPVEDPNDLLEALAGVAATLPEDSLDREAVYDAASAIELQHQERAELCRALDAHRLVITGLQEQLDLSARLAASHENSAKAFEAAWREALKAPEVKQRWWACGVGLSAGVEADATGYGGIGGACIIALWP